MILLHFLFMASKLRSVDFGYFFEVIMKRGGSKETACHMVEGGDGLVKLDYNTATCNWHAKINHLLNF